MINSAQKDRVIAVLIKYGLKEQAMAKNLFIKDDGSNIAADLRGKEPKIGVWIGNEVQTEKHGVLRVQDIQNEVVAAMKYLQFKSSASDLSASSKENAKGSHPASGGIDKAPELKNRTETSKDTKPNDDVMKGVIPGESKLGAGDTLVEAFGKVDSLIADRLVESVEKKKIEQKKGTNTATCEGCSKKIQGSIVEFQEIEAKYNGIYCPDCVTRDKYLGKAKTPEANTDQKATPAKPEQRNLKIPMCCDCGIEVSHKEALDCITNEEKVRCEQCKGKHDKAKHQETQKGKDEAAQERKTRSEESKGVTNMDEKLPARQEQAKSPAKMSDQERDDMIEVAKAKRFLEGQGGSYSVSGKNRPDSAMVQKVANASDISSEILVAEQTKDYAHVVVRGHRGNNYVDAVVHHDFETEFQLQTMEIIKKNPQILDHYEELIPVIKEGAIVTIGFGDKQTTVDAKYYLIHALLTFKTFSLRDATTKAMQIVQSKLLNQDPRTKEEVASEQKERDPVEEKRNQRR